jgi:hypothetical protein
MVEVGNLEAIDSFDFIDSNKEIKNITINKTIQDRRETFIWRICENTYTTNKKIIGSNAFLPPIEEFSFVIIFLL